MGHQLSVEYLSYDDLRDRSLSFLRKYHRAGTIPVPIEEIIDRQFRINIIPFPELRRVYDKEAFITSNMENLYVDEYTYTNVATRYRFSLAHEIGHAFLHQKVYRELAFENIETWINAHEQMDSEDKRWLEWQAHAFAGLVLVPLEHLSVLYESAWKRAKGEVPALNQGSPEVTHILASSIAKDFEVSTPVIERRLEYERDRNNL